MPKIYLIKLSKELHPFKTAIISVVVSVVSAFIVSIIASTGKQLITDEMNSLGINGISVSAYSNSGENHTNDTLFNTIQSFSTTLNASPVIYNAASVSFTNGKSLNTMAWGINKQAANIISLNVIHGRNINQSDISSGAPVCLVDEKIAQKIYKRSNITGKIITVSIGGRTATLEIIGTVQKGSNILNNLAGDAVSNFIYMPYTTLKNLSGKNSYDQIVFTSSDASKTPNEFKEKLVDANYIYRNKTIKLTNLSNQKEQIISITDTAFLSLFIISCVSVIVCSMAVAASVNTAILARQKDIGIKMSMGAGRFDIIREFLLSSVVACAVGIIISVLSMEILINTISLFTPYKINIDYSLILISIFATMFLTVIFSFVPSYNASKISPIQALSRE